MIEITEDSRGTWQRVETSGSSSHLQVAIMNRHMNSSSTNNLNQCEILDSKSNGT